MAGISGRLSRALVERLKATADGVNARIGAIESADGSVGAGGIRSVVGLHAGVEITEKSGHAQYPVVLVYCERLTNSLKEKFRRFSGRARMVVEVRNSADRLEGLDAVTHICVDAVCALLDDSRGDWSGGTFYAGGYEVTYEAVARGGKNFLQRAKVAFDVEISL